MPMGMVEQREKCDGAGESRSNCWRNVLDVRREGIQ